MRRRMLQLLSLITLSLLLLALIPAAFAAGQAKSTTIQSRTTSSQLITNTYPLENFEDGDYINNFGGNWGELIDKYVTLTRDTNTSTCTGNTSLKVDYHFSKSDKFTGLWMSLWGDIDNKSQYLDFTRGVEEIYFWVRGNGNTGQKHKIKVELKDARGDYDYTAYRYITIDDSDTSWQKVVLDGDVTNGSFWKFNRYPPAATQMKEFVFVIEEKENRSSGAFYIDCINIVFSELSPVSGLDYIFDNFDDRDEAFNDFSGNWGPFSAAGGNYITTTFVSAPEIVTEGAALKVDYKLPDNKFTGIWQSLWGHSDYLAQTLDFTDIYGDFNDQGRDFEQIHFRVRGSGLTASVHNLKIELKDARADEEDAYNHTAYRYIHISDEDTSWRKVVLDADVTNAAFWSYNQHPPDPTQMKQLVLVIESDFNDPAGTFYLDDIHFVDEDDAPFDLPTHTDDEFLDLVSQKTFLYFLDWYEPNTGLFQDRSTFPDLFSTAATGFGLTALTIGEYRGWIERDLAVEMITRTLKTLRDGQSAADTVTDTVESTNGYKGFYYHFLGTDGLRSDLGSELSPVDTALLMAGILTVKEHFNDVQEIVDLADELYERVEWGWMVNPDKNWFYLAWTPDYAEHHQIAASEGGYFSNYHWDYYTDEAFLIAILAAGSPTHPVSKDVFYAVFRDWGTYKDHTLIRSWSGSFFTYVFAHLWIDFATLGKDKHISPTLQIDWQQNSVEAACANWQFAVDHQDDKTCDGDDDYTTYSSLSWGLTASDGPDEADPYHAYGAWPAAVPPDHDGTVQPYGAGMATMFLPEKAIPALKNYFVNTDLWRYRFGFGDAYNLDPPDCNGPWYNHAAFGIDQGPMLISIENYRSGFIWELMKRSDPVCRALNSIWTTLCTPISGPTLGVQDTPYTFIAEVKPFTTTAPITIVWQAEEQSPITHVYQPGGTGSFTEFYGSDTVTFTWNITGAKSITVTAISAYGVGSDTHQIHIGYNFYLPLILR